MITTATTVANVTRFITVTTLTTKSILISSLKKQIQLVPGLIPLATMALGPFSG